MSLGPSERSDPLRLRRRKPGNDRTVTRDYRVLALSTSSWHHGPISVNTDPWQSTRPGRAAGSGLIMPWHRLGLTEALIRDFSREWKPEPLLVHVPNLLIGSDSDPPGRPVTARPAGGGIMA
eukprot:582238-Hanusia_phi.AAC.1